jgi:hypothetical protein
MLRPAALRLSAGLLALAVSGAALADARADLHAAFVRNLAAKSYRATISDLASGREVARVEFQAPDRYRIVAAGRPAGIIAGGKMYMDVNGRKLSVPAPAGMLENYRSDAAWKRMETQAQISDAGASLVGAEPARKFHWVSSGKHASSGDAWVGLKSGRVLQVRIAGKAGAGNAGPVQVRYSDFDSAAIRIEAP